jgi:uncharacterized repeat protein (TIGR01451 family)
MSKKDLGQQGDGGGGTKQCPICGAENAPDASVCTGCSFTFEADDIAETTAAPDSGSTVCNDCGAELPAGTTSCFICGAEIGTPSTETIPEPPAEETPPEEEWDAGVVGGDAEPAPEEVTEEPEEIPEQPTPELPELGENEFHCPSCGKPIAMGTSKCPECWAEIPEMIRCPKCDHTIPLSSEVCAECFAKLKNGVLIEEPPEEMPEPAELPAEDLNGGELEEHIDEVTEIYGVECPFCHEIANPGDDICPECGMPLIEREEPAEEELAPRKKPERDWYRIIAIGVVAVLLVSGILPFAIPLPHVDRLQIRIDGAFGDWDQVSGQNDSVLSTLPANVDIVQSKMLSDAFNIYFFMQVRGQVFGDQEGDTARIFIDTDQDPATGYSIMGLGADYQIRVFGHGGDVESSSCLAFDDSKAQNDFNGFVSASPSVPHAPEAVQDAAKFEVRATLGDIGITQTTPVTAVFYMADSHGNRDYSDLPISSLGSVLFVRQSSIAPANGLMTGSASPAISLEIHAIGQSVDINGITVPNCAPGTFVRTMANGTSQTLSLTTSVTSLSAGSLVVREAAPDDFDVSGAHVVVTGQGAYAYAVMAPALIGIDGAFADWNGKGTTNDDKADDQLSKNGIDSIADAGLDMVSQTAARENNQLNILVQTNGTVLAGMWVPEIEEAYVDTGANTRSEATKPDYTYTEPEVSKTRAPNIQRPTVKSAKTGEGAVNVYLDTDNDTATGYSIGGRGADYLVKIMGQNGKVTATSISIFSGSDRNMPSWTLQAGLPLGASSGSGVEIGIPLGLFTGITPNTSAVIQLVDWNLNGDVSDISMWDVFETGTRAGTRADPGLPGYGHLMGTLLTSGNEFVPGATLVLKDLTGRATTRITVENTIDSYSIAQEVSKGLQVNMYAVNNTLYGANSTTLTNDKTLAKCNIMMGNPIPAAAPTGLEAKVFGAIGVRLTWTTGATPTSFNIFKTTNTTTSAGDVMGRYYGISRLTGISGTATEFIDTNVANNTVYYYFIESVTGAQVHYSQEVSVTVNYSAVPVITHQPIADCTASVVTVKATVTDDSGIKFASVFYRKGSSGAWTSAPMTLSSGSPSNGNWVAGIPVEMTDINQLYQYYLTADDGSNLGMFGGSGAPGYPTPFGYNASYAPSNPFPVYGYVYLYDGTFAGGFAPVPQPGATVTVSWYDFSMAAVNTTSDVTNALGQFSIDLHNGGVGDPLGYGIEISSTASTGNTGYNWTAITDWNMTGGIWMNVLCGVPYDVIITNPLALPVPAVSANVPFPVTYRIVDINGVLAPGYFTFADGPMNWHSGDPLFVSPPDVYFDGTSSTTPGTWTGNLLLQTLGATYINVTENHLSDFYLTPFDAIAYQIGGVATPGYLKDWANLTLTVVGQSVFNLTKWAPAFANPGEIFSYWLNYSNEGTQWMYNVSISESYPPGVTFISSIPPPTIGTDYWFIGTIAPGGSNSIQIFVSVNMNATGTLTNTASITAPSITTVWAFANTTVINPLMTVKKSAPATANAGETMMYTIRYWNNGTDWAQNVWIYEDYPMNVNVLNATPMPTAWPGTWYIGDLAPGATGTIFVNVTVNAGFSGTLYNEVLLTYENDVVSMPDARAWANTTVNNPLLNVDKTAPATANSGAQIVYAIHIWNSGTATAFDVVVTDTLPAGTTYVPVATPPPSSVVGQTLTWTLPPIAPGASVWIYVTVQVSETATGTISNTVSVVYEDAAGQELGPVTDTATFAIADPLLTIQKVGPAYANSGQTITYTIWVNNTGSAPAYNITVTETYPADATFVSSNPPPSFGNNVWNISFLAAHGGTQISVTVLISATPGTVWQNNTVIADYEDGSNEDQADVTDVVTTILNNPQLTLAKTAPEFANPDQDITYTVTVTNIGSEPAYNVIVTESYPAGVSFVSANPAPTTPINVWNLGSIPVGGSITIVITVHINAGTTGLLTNTVAADYESSSGQDYHVTAYDTTMVTWPVMNIWKDGPANSTAGSTIMYTIHYQNLGSDTAYNVTITETYPADTTFLNANPTPTVGNNVWVIPSVAPGTGGVIFVNVTISSTATGMLVNSISAIYKNTDNQTMPEITNETYTFLTGPWMNIEKTGPATANTGETIIYTLHYWNSGDDTAYNVNITEIYPIEVTFVSANPAPTYGNNIWLIPTVAPGVHGWINITVTINDGVTGTVTNYVNLNYRNDANVQLPAETGNWTIIILDPFMIIEKTGPGQANPGQVIMYTITYQNIGLGTAYNVVITDTLDSGVSYVSSFPVGALAGQVLTWNIGTLLPGQGGTIFINVTITATNGTIINIVSVDYDDAADEDQNDVEDIVITTLINPFLIVEKMGPAAAVPGQTITYWINGTNIGNDWAYDIWVNDTLPAGLTFLGSIPAFNTSFGSTYSWFIGYLAPGGKFSIQITAQVTATSGEIVNFANITFKNDADIVQPVIEIQTSPMAIVDCLILITKTAPETANTGEFITYTIAYINVGLSTAYNVVITDTLPIDVTYYSSIPSGTVIGQVIAWNIGTLAPYASGSIQVTVQVNEGLPIDTELINNVVVTYENGGNIVNQTSDFNITTVIDPLVEITKWAPPTGAPGGILTYLVNYTNSGNDTAYNVVITETYPTGVTFLDANPMPNNPPTNNVWNLGNLAPGASGTIFINVTISTTADGTLVNTVQIICENDADVEFTDQDTVNTPIVGPYVQIVKTGPANAAPGDTISYTITYSNTGPGIAYNVRVYDTLPAGVAFVNAIASGILQTAGPPTWVWWFGNLAPGASGTIVITVTVNADATLLINNASVEYYTDPGFVNRIINNCTFTTVVNSPLLTIEKTANATACTGQIITYDITVTNTGSNVANNVIVTENYPDGVTYLIAVPLPTSGNNVWNLSQIKGISMPVGAVWTITVTLRVNATAIGVLHNAVNVRYWNQANAVMPVVWAYADTTIVNPLLTIDKTAPAEANTGELITYTLTVTNVGTAPAFNIWVNESYPPGVTYVSSNILPINFGGDNDSWYIPFLANGATITITITVRVDALTGTLTNWAFVNYTNFADMPLTEVDDFAITTIVNPIMGITKWAPATANPGQTFTYWINYTNTGDGWAYNVVITETYPAGVSFVSSTPDPSSGNNVWNFGPLASGATGSIQITVQVLAGTVGWVLNNSARLDFQNQAGIPQLTISAWAVTNVVQPAMTVIKTGPATATQGQTILYTIFYQNTGNDIAYNVIITDAVPLGVSFVNSTPNPTSPGVWVIGNLAPGASGYIYITATIGAATTGIITNWAYVNYKNRIIPLDQVGDSALTTIIVPRMTITKTAPDYANTGETITYTISYQNLAAVAAYNVVITDTLPVGVTYVSSTPPGSAAGQTVTWNVGILGPGASGTITVNVIVTATDGTLTNTVRASYRNQYSVVYPVVWDTDSTIIINPIITVEKSAPATANTGQNIEYVIWVNNTGTDIAYNVTITETYPVGVIFVFAFPVPTSSNNVWNLGNLAPGTATPIFITVTVNATGLLVNSAEARFNNYVGIPQTPVTDTASTLVGDPLMFIQKTAPLNANPGQTIMYTIRYWNNGTAPAYNVIITETYPAGVTFLNANPMPGNPPTNTVWTIPTVPSHGSGVIFINVTISATATGFIENNVLLAYTDAANNPKPSVTDQAITVLTGPYVLLTKTGPGYANPGQIIMYTVTYRNIGTDTAYNVWINETYPAFVTFLNATPAPTTGNNAWNFGNLAPGAFGTIFINVTVATTATGTIHNNVTAVFRNSVGEQFSSDATWPTIILEPVMQIVKTGPAGANPGATITYWINYTNTGSDWAYDVTITETYPAGVTYITAIPLPTTGNNVWNFGSLAPGASGSIQITVTIGLAVTGSITNTVRVDYDNQAGRAMVPVTATFVTLIVNPLLSLEKTAWTVLPGTVFPNEIFTYQIIYTNIGGGWAYDVRITESFPTGVTFLDATPPPTFGNQWLVGPLAPGASGSILITVRVNSGATGTLLNNITANYENSLGEMPPVYAELALQVIAPRLQITKTAPATANTGQDIVYRIWVNNTGNAWATDIILTETYPASVTFIEAVPVPTVQNTVWYVPDLGPGGSWFVEITVRVNLDAYGTLLNSVAVTFRDMADQSYGPVLAQAMTLIQDPMVTISKTGPATANPGQVIMYTITYENIGTAPANVIITETYPASVTFLNATPMPGNPENTIWNIGSVAPSTGGTIFINVTVSVTASGTLTNIVVLDYSSATRDFKSKQAVWNTTIVEPDMTLSKTAPAQANSGQTITYWLNYFNEGTDWAYNVTVTETYPDGVTFLSATPAPTTIPNFWSIGNVAPNTGGSIQITVRVNATAFGTLTNYAILNYRSAGRIMPYVEATAQTKVIDPILIITKDAPANANQGETITYTITVRNIGSDFAYNVWVFENYPGTIFQSSVPTPAFPSNDVWYFDSIAPDSFVVITITVTVPLSASGYLDNAAYVDYFDLAGEPQDREWAFASTYVTGPSLTVNKWATPYANAGDYLTYWINITNTGTGWAYNVFVTESYPAGVTFVSAIPTPNPGNTTWNLGSIAPNHTVKIQITVQVNIGTVGILVNRADVDYENQIGVDYTPVWDIAVTTLGDIPNVIIQKTAPQYANAGQTINYTIFYHNAATIWANNTWINETYPFGVTYVPVANPAPSVGNNCWFIDDLAPGQSGYIFISVTVTGAVYGTLTNMANIVYWNGNLTRKFENYASANTIVRDALMQVDKSAPDTVAINQQFLYTITYTNIGNDTAYDVWVVDTLPGGVSFVTSSIPPDASSVPPVYRWHFASIAPGASAGITITVQANVAGVQVNTVTVDYENTLGVARPQVSDSATTVITGLATPYVTIQKSAPAQAVTGQVITYLITYQNIGDGIANNVVVTDTLPLGVTFLNATPTEDSIAGQLVTWNNLAPIGSGVSGTIFVNVTVNALSGTLANQANVVWTGGSNVAYAYTTIVSPLMQVTKTVNETMAQNGETLHYTITYTNVGSAPAYDVTIVDTLPPGSSYLGATPPFTSSAPPMYTWVIPIVPDGSSGTIFLDALVNVVSGTLTNNVSLNYDNAIGTAQLPDYAEATTEITAVELILTKTTSSLVAEPGTDITYFITIYNRGPTLGTFANDVTLNDFYPAGTTLLTAQLDINGGGWNPAGPNASVAGINHTWYLSSWLGPMPAGDVWILQLVVHIDWMAPDVLENRAMVNYTESGFVHFLNATAVTTISGPLMDITKTSSMKYVSPGQEFIYTINYVNNGPGPALNVTIREFYPAGLTFLSSIPAPSEGNNVWHLGTIGGLNNPPNSGQIIIRVRVNAMAGGVLTNRATLNYQNISGGWMPEESAFNTTTVLTGNTRMYIDKSGPATATTGQYVEYTIYYQNIGTGMALNVVLEDTFLASDLSFLSASRTPSYGGPGDTTIGWNLGNLAPHDSGTIIVRCTIGLAPGPSAQNFATIYFTDTVGNPGSISDMASTWIHIPVLNITKEGPAFANSGQYITYWINYTNTNPIAAAYNVTITETYSLNVTYLIANPLPTTGTNVWFIGTVSPGGSGSIIITVRVLGTVANGGAVFNYVNLAYENMGYIAQPVESAFVTTTIYNPILQVGKTGPASANTGQLINYTITLNNIGGAPAYNIEIADLYPSQVTYVGASLTPSIGNNRWLIPFLINGGSIQFNITVRIGYSVTPGITIHNDVFVDYEDGNGGAKPQEWARASTLIVDPLLRVTKTGPAIASTNQTITYLITVENFGNADAYNILLNELYPSNQTARWITFVNSSQFPTGAGNDTWTIFSLAPGATWVLWINVTVLVQCDINNTVTVAYRDYPGEIQEPVSDYWVTTIENPCMIIRKTANATAVAGGYILYNITAENIGTGNATNVIVTEYYPVGTAFVWASITPTSGNNEWTFASLPVGFIGWLNILVRVNGNAVPASLLNNTVHFAYQNQGGMPMPQLNVSASTRIIGPSIQILKSAPGYVEIGQIFNYTIQYWNNGTDWAYNVVIRDIYPSALTILGTEPAPATIQLGYYEWTVSAIAPGTTGIIRMTVLADRATTLINNASLSYRNAANLLYPTIFSLATTQVSLLPYILPPEITTTPPEFVWAGQNFTLYADALGMGADIDTVILYFTDISGTTWYSIMVPLLITLNGSGVYSIVMPAQSFKGFISYFVWVNDTNGNENRTGIYDVAVRLPPYFVWGNIYSNRGNMVANAIVQITDTVTNETVMAITDSGGRYTVDLATLYSGYMNGENLVVYATDGSFYGRNESFIDLDGYDDLTMAFPNRRVNVVLSEIPEFATILVPLIGLMVLVAFLERRRRKREDAAVI